MPRAQFGTRFDSPTVDVFVDMGHPFVNRTVDSFLKIGIVGASHAAVIESINCLTKGSVSQHDLESGLKKVVREGLHWGAIAGVYTGMEYGMQQTRGTHDWKNAMLGGALTGAILNVADSKYTRDNMLRSAATGGALATAAELLTHLL